MWWVPLTRLLTLDVIRNVVYDRCGGVYMPIYGDIVPLSELSPGEWFVLMRRNYDDIPDSLEPLPYAYQLHAVECNLYMAWFDHNGRRYPQPMVGHQLVRRCDPTR